MKNRKLFTVVVVLFLLIALSVPFAAGVFYDPDNGAVYASSWTFWDPDQPDISIPYLDVWTTVMEINNTHEVDKVTTRLELYSSPVAIFVDDAEFEIKNIYYPVPAPDANLYHSDVAGLTFK
jgi:hypothetical protein